MTQSPAPAPMPPSYQYEHPDASALKVLTILQFVWGGLTVLGSCGCLFYLVMGIFFVSAPPKNAEGAEVVGPIFIVMGSVGSLLVISAAVVSFISAASISARRRRTFCIAASAFHCLFFPLGTALGVFGLVMLLKPAVKDLFEGRWQPHQPVIGSAPPRAPSA